MNFYENHKLDVIQFEPACVFADLGVSGDESGGIVVHSVNPGTADR
ncbi:MAG: hypothetical protein LUF29_07115 [Oscillospiraceae bacterium]|nr:hypothetical protein [Oscillospiraceae bacterium]